MVIIERKLRSCAADGLAILHKFLDTSYLRKRRSHGTYSPSSDLLGVSGESCAILMAAAANMK